MALNNIYNFNKIEFIIDIITIAKVITKLNLFKKLYLLQLKPRNRLLLQYILILIDRLYFFILFLKVKIYIKIIYKNNKIFFN